MSMPEASIYENDNLSFEDDDIGCSRQSPVMSSETNAMPAQESFDEPLWKRIGRSHPTHQPAAFFS